MLIGSNIQEWSDSAQLDPKQVKLYDLVAKDYVIERMSALREGGKAFAGLFAIDNQDITLLDDIFGETPTDYPKEEVKSLIAKIRDTGDGCYSQVSNDLFVNGYPVWLYHDEQKILKGCFIYILPGLVSCPNSVQNIVLLMGDLFSGQISAAFSNKLSKAAYKALDDNITLGSSQLTSVINNIGARLVLLDPDLRIVWNNTEVSEKYGRTDLKGKYCYKEFRAEEEVCEGCFVRRTFETGQSQNGEFSYHTPVIGHCHFNITTTPVFDEQGNVRQVLEFSYDITAARRVESELAQYKGLVDSSNDYMMICNDDGKLLAVNRKITDDFGYLESEFVGKNVSDFFPKSKKIDDIASRARNSGMTMDLLHIKKKDGSAIPMNLFVSYDKDNCVYEIIFSDMSEHLRMQEEIRKRSEELQEQNKKVLAAIDEKNRFFRNVSHELRTPLTSVIGFAELLQEDTDQPLSPRQRLQLERVVGNAHKLLGLVNDLLDLSKIEAQRMTVELSNIDLDNFLRQVINNMTPLAKDKNLVINVDVQEGLQIIRTDEQKLGQIMVNLISNAIKFTREGSISISAVKDSRLISISVRDTGIGIPQDELENVFKEFYQGSRQGPAQRGTGLGLAIAQRLSSVLGGKITVESEPGVGSTFRLELPMLNLTNGHYQGPEAIA